MSILNYTTSISSEKTIAEIQKCLVKHGARKIVTDYEGEVPISLTFLLPLQQGSVAFALPANSAGVLKAMKKDPKVPNSLPQGWQFLPFLSEVGVVY